MTSGIRNDPSISDDEIIWRRIYQVVYDNNLKRVRPTSACYSQNDPGTDVSVYVGSIAQSAAVVMQGGREQYLGALRAGFIRSLGLGIVFDPSTGGPGHALIRGRKTRSMLDKMAKAASWVPPYQP
jgi:hypothetical protein